MSITKPQQRMLDDVREAGVKVYNGRAARTIKALEAAGLVTVTWVLQPTAIGQWREVWTVKPTETEAEKADRLRDEQREADYIRDYPRKGSA